MADIRSVTPGFAVAPQIALQDIPGIAAAGFKTLINNRPDGEAPGQMSDAEAAAAAAAAGMAYAAIPFAGAPRMEQVEATIKALNAHPGPVLAFCRSGTRSITVWALAQAVSGAMGPDAILEAAQAAGYDLTPHRPVLAQLADR